MFGDIGRHAFRPERGPKWIAAGRLEIEEVTMVAVKQFVLHAGYQVFLAETRDAVHSEQQRTASLDHLRTPGETIAGGHDVDVARPLHVWKRFEKTPVGLLQLPRQIRNQCPNPRDQLREVGKIVSARPGSIPLVLAGRCEVIEDCLMP